MSDQTPGPDAPEPDVQPDVEPAIEAGANHDGEPTQPITGVGWTSPSDSHQPPVPVDPQPAPAPQSAYQPAYQPAPSPIPPQHSPTPAACAGTAVMSTVDG